LVGTSDLIYKLDELQEKYQAKGVIMERYNGDAMRAFDMLRQLSQDMKCGWPRLLSVVDSCGD
jgi:AmiR/NasT family two-component response regulator